MIKLPTQVQPLPRRSLQAAAPPVNRGTGDAPGVGAHLASIYSGTGLPSILEQPSLSKHTDRPLKDYFRICGPAFLSSWSVSCWPTRWAKTGTAATHWHRHRPAGDPYHLFAQRYRDILAVRPHLCLAQSASDTKTSLSDSAASNREYPGYLTRSHSWKRFTSCGCT